MRTMVIAATLKVMYITHCTTEKNETNKKHSQPTTAIMFIAHYTRELQKVLVNE